MMSSLSAPLRMSHALVVELPEYISTFPLDAEQFAELTSCLASPFVYKTYRFQQTDVELSLSILHNTGEQVYTFNFQSSTVSCQAYGKIRRETTRLYLRIHQADTCR